VSERLVIQGVRRFVAIGVLAALAACGGDTSGPPATTATVDLQPGEYGSFAGNAISGAIAFPAAGAQGASWLVVGQLVSGATDQSGTVRLGGASLVAGAQPAWASVSRVTAADRFHAMLRHQEAAIAAQFARNPFLRAVPAVPHAPPQVGDKRTFKVCGNLDCSSLKTITATAQWAGAHAVIFVDDTIPANGFTPTDLSDIGSQFDGVLYPIDVDRFGAESDIDGNGVVLVLLTDAVNALVGKPDCTDAFVTGFFYGADLAPGLATSHNNGEVFYGMVPDPAGSVACAYSTSLVKRIMPVTFVHEFQHMISYNQKVLLHPGNSAEELWLNEAMSHLAEELAGLHYDSLGDQTWKSRFQIGDLYNAYKYLTEPNAHFLLVTDATGTLEERGAGWLFVRWLVDRYGANLSRTLVQTPQVGVLAVQQATGAPIESLLTRWALALFVSDLPGFTPPAGIPYTSWHFRTTFLSLHQQDPADFPAVFPLTPDSSVGAAVLLTGNLQAGSGAYVMPQQPAGGGAFALTFSAGVNALAGPQVTVLRLR